MAARRGRSAERLNRGFFFAAENVAQRKCIAVSSDFHGLHRRFGRSCFTIARRCRSRSSRNRLSGNAVQPHSVAAVPAV